MLLGTDKHAQLWSDLNQTLEIYLCYEWPMALYFFYWQPHDESRHYLSNGGPSKKTKLVYI